MLKSRGKVCSGLVREVGYVIGITLAKISNYDVSEMMLLYLFPFTYSAGDYCKF